MIHSVWFRDSALAFGTVAGLLLFWWSAESALRYGRSYNRLRAAARKDKLELNYIQAMRGFSRISGALAIAAVFFLFVSDWRPLSFINFTGMMIIDMCFLFGILDLLVPAWRAKGYLPRQIRIALWWRIVLAGITGTLLALAFA